MVLNTHSHVHRPSLRREGLINPRVRHSPLVVTCCSFETNIRCSSCLPRESGIHPEDTNARLFSARPTPFSKRGQKGLRTPYTYQ